MSDARDALRSEEGPSYDEYRLGRVARGVWRYVYAVAALLVVGGILDLLGLIS